MSGWRVMHLILLLACAGARVTLGFLARLVPNGRAVRALHVC
jgi:hypothetical protein